MGGPGSCSLQRNPRSMRRAPQAPTRRAPPPRTPAASQAGPTTGRVSVWSRSAACTAARTVPWKPAPLTRSARRSAIACLARAKCSAMPSSSSVPARSSSACRPAESMCVIASASKRRGRDGRRAAQCFLHSALDANGVGEEQAIVEPVDDDARRDDGVIVERDVGPAEDGVVGAGAAADDVDHRQARGEEDRFQDAGADHARGGHGGDRELDLVGVGEFAPSQVRVCRLPSGVVGAR